MRARRNSAIGFLYVWLVAAIVAGGVFAQAKPDNKALLAGFEKGIESGKTADVESGLFNYVVANPKDPQGFYVLAKLRLAQGRTTEAKALLNKTLTIDPKMVQAKLVLADAEFKTGNAETARAIVAGIRDYPDASTIFPAAKMAAMIGDCRTALALAEKLPPALKNGKALPLRATCYLESGDTKQFAALTPFAKSLARSNPGVAIEFATALSKAAMHKETAELVRTVLAAAPQNVDALLLLAKSEISLKDFTAAKDHLAKAAKIQSQSAGVLLVSALLESEQGNNAKALELLEKALAADADNIEILSRLVVIALRANQNGKSMRAAEKLLSLQPSNLDFLYLQGIAALQSNNLKIAEASLTRFLDARPTDSLGCLALGLTFAAQPERIGEARTQLEKCLATNSANFEAAYQLGLSYKVQGETATAVRYLEQTVRVAPNYAPALRDLGALYLQSGEETKARPILEKSASIAPNDAEVHFQLSRLYNLLGEPDLARKHLEIFQKLRNPKKDGM